MITVASGLDDPVALAVLSGVAGVVALGKQLIKPSDRAWLRASTMAIAALLLIGAFVAIIFGSTSDVPPGPDLGEFQEHVGAICDRLDDAAGDYAKVVHGPDPYAVVGPYKVYEAREADLRELQAPTKLRTRFAETTALARRHTEAIVVTTNQIVGAHNDAERRRVIKARTPRTERMERQLATDLRALGGDQCDLSTFGTASVA